MKNITLGKLIRTLEGKDPERLVYFDRFGLVPDVAEIASWRGVYAQLAIGWKTRENPPTVAELLAALKPCVGKTFHGYKGGEYTMHDDTEMWADNWGCYTSTAIVGVESNSYGVTLITANKDI